ncbi:uncharacterized protein [Arachis hypogaea]|uniref:uncharacterized protein n=1 Tax=Arachis hypogaea TaxID=3818 RepID=UPI000DEC0519|nr:uncharacterized protein LOC112748771 [Arachis hypogaea]
MQRDRETLYEYWERFKKLLEACPHHRIEELVLINYFCQGMNPQDKLLLDASSGGSLTKNKTAEEGWEIIADLVDSTQRSRARNPQPKALSEVSPSGDAVLTKTLGEMTILLRQITQGQQLPQALISSPPQPPRIEGPPRSCGICACNNHYTDKCPQLQEDTTLAVANSYPQRPNYNQHGNQNQGWRDNSNQRWNQAPQAQPYLSQQAYYHQAPQGRINAITLRSGTKLDEIGVVPTSSSEETHKEKVGDDMGVMKDEEEDVEKDEEGPLKAKEPKRKNSIEEPMPIPFPTLAKKAKKQKQLDPNMVEIFKNVEVTVPLFQAIQHVPKYAKFLKDLCTHKEKIGELKKGR